MERIHDRFPITDERWFPRRARRLGRQILLALMDKDLRAVLHLETPSKPVERLVRASARASSPLMLVRPFRSDRSWLDYFGRHRVGAPDFERMGHRPRGPTGPSAGDSMLSG